jgi:hypothetical protein
MHRRFLISGFLLLLFGACIGARPNKSGATIIYDEKVTAIRDVDRAGGQLWITTTDLQRATDFELKPQGVCRGALCFPVPSSRYSQFVRKTGRLTWFSLTAFADLVHQPVAHDDALAIWYFGLRADQRQGLASLEAPDFTLPDMSGKLHSLSDFRGKKVLLLTWASW